MHIPFLYNFYAEIPLWFLFDYYLSLSGVHYWLNNSMTSGEVGEIGGLRDYSEVLALEKFLIAVPTKPGKELA